MRGDNADDVRAMADSALDDTALGEALAILHERVFGWHVRPFGLLFATHNAPPSAAEYAPQPYELNDEYKKKWYAHVLDFPEPPTAQAGKAVAVGVRRALRALVMPETAQKVFAHFTSNELPFIEQCVDEQFRWAHRVLLTTWADCKEYDEPAATHAKMLRERGKMPNDDGAAHVSVLRPCKPGRAVLTLLSRSSEALAVAHTIALRFVTKAPKQEFRPCYRREHVAFGVNDVRDVRRLRRLDLRHDDAVDRMCSNYQGHCCAGAATGKCGPEWRRVGRDSRFAHVSAETAVDACSVRCWRRRQCRRYGAAWSRP